MSTFVRRVLITGVVTLTFAVIGVSSAPAHHLFNWMAPSHVPVGAGTSGVVTADFTNDGHADIAAIATNGGAGGTGRVALSTGNGQGSFTAFGDVRLGGAPVAIEAANVNADSYPDLVVANSLGTSSPLAPGAVDFGRRVLSAGASAGVNFTLTNGSQAGVVVGVSITGTAADQFLISINTCMGPIAPGASCNVVVAFDPATTGTKSATLEVLTNFGIFTAALTGRSGSPSAALTPISTDFGGRVVGGGSSAATSFRFTNRTAARIVTNVSITGGGAGSFSISADGCTGQLLAVNASCVVSVRFAPTSNGVKSASLALTTNPALPDLVASLSGAGSAGEIAVLVNDGTGDFSLSTSLAMDTPSDVKLDKIDRDDTFDILASSVASDSLVFWPGQNDGRFGAPLVTSVSNPTSFFFGNVNSGSARDVVVASSADDLVRVLIGDRTGRFSAGATYTANDPRSVSVVFKINKDNFRDVVYTEYGSNEVSYRLGVGDGTFGAETSFAVSTPTRLVVGDVSNQADDLLVTDEAGNRVSILLGCGGSIVPGVCATPGAAFDPATHWPVGTTPRDIAIGNFDNAFSADVVVANAGSGNVSIMLNQTPCPGSGGGCD